MGIVGVLETFELFLEGTIGLTLWLAGVFLIGMAITALVMVRASRLGKPLVVQVLWGLPVVVLTLLVWSLGFGPFVLTLFRPKWAIILFLSMGGVLLYAAVLQWMINARAAVAGAGTGPSETGEPTGGTDG